MINVNKEKIKLVLLMVLTLWTLSTSFVYWVSNPTKSQMEIFLHIPKSFILKDMKEEK